MRDFVILGPVRDFLSLLAVKLKEDLIELSADRTLTTIFENKLL